MLSNLSQAIQLDNRCTRTHEPGQLALKSVFVKKETNLLIKNNIYTQHCSNQKFMHDEFSRSEYT